MSEQELTQSEAPSELGSDELGTSGLGSMEDMAADADAVLGGAMREMRRQAIMPMLIRSAITGLILYWLSTKFPWVRWIFGLWAIFTAFMFSVLLFLPRIVKGRVRTMTEGAREAMERAGEAGLYPEDEEIADLEHTEPVPLEEQLEELESVGVRLAEGRTIDDLLARLDREAFEDEPYALLLYTLGTRAGESADGVLCDRALTLDAQCIEGPDSYTLLVSRFARLSNKADRVTGLRAAAAPDDETIQLAFELDGSAWAFEPRIADDWVDETALKGVVDAFADDSHGFYGILNGRFSAVIYLDRDDAQDFADLVPAEVVEIA